MVSLKRTSDVQSHHLKILVYGAAGAGKTRLIGTAKDPLIISAESGLLSLRDIDVPYIEVKTLADVQDAYTFVSKSEEAKAFRWVCLDSISEIAETVLAAEKKAAKDPRKAYGEMMDTMRKLVRAFRDLEKNVYISAKMETIKDETGAVGYGPSMPGNKLANDLPFFMDEVLALRAVRGEDGTVERFLQTQPDGAYTAKDRSGVLDSFEAPDLEALASKIVTPNK